MNNYRIVKQWSRDENAKPVVSYNVEFYQSHPIGLGYIGPMWDTVKVYKTLKQAKTCLKNLSTPLPESEVIE
jgi:hypothetical protein